MRHLHFGTNRREPIPLPIFLRGNANQPHQIRPQSADSFYRANPSNHAASQGPCPPPKERGLQSYASPGAPDTKRKIIRTVPYSWKTRERKSLPSSPQTQPPPPPPSGAHARTHHELSPRKRSNSGALLVTVTLSESA